MCSDVVLMQLLVHSCAPHHEPLSLESHSLTHVSSLFMWYDFVQRYQVLVPKPLPVGLGHTFSGSLVVCVVFSSLVGPPK